MSWKIERAVPIDRLSIPISAARWRGGASRGQLEADQGSEGFEVATEHSARDSPGDEEGQREPVEAGGGRPDLGPKALWIAVLGTVALTQLGCGGVSPEATAPPLEVSYAGCPTVRPGPVCYLRAGGDVRVWARSSPAATLEIEGPVEILEQSEDQAGTLFRLRPTALPGALRVIAREGAAPETAWRLPLRLLAPRSEVMIRVEAEIVAGRYEAARRVLDAGWSTLADDDLGMAYRELGRIEQMAGDDAAAAAAHDRAIQVFRQRGMIRQVVSCATEVAYGLIYGADRLAEARALLDGLELGPDDPAEAWFNRAYLRGLLAINTGDLRGSLRHLRDSAEIAQRVGLTAWRHSAEQPLGHQLQRVGRRAEAAAIYDRHQREIPGDLSPCDRGFLLNNMAWNQLLLGESGHGDDLHEDPTPWLEEARQLFAEQPCSETDERANVAINLALAALHDNRPETAEDHLRRALSLDPRPDLRARFWRLEIAARIALARDRPGDALERYRELDALARVSLSYPSQWRAAAGQAAALEALGRPAEALEAYTAADAYLDRASFGVPIDSGRESFVDRAALVTRRHLDLLLRLDRAPEAFELARRTRTRVLRSLHSQNRLSRLSAAEQARWDVAISAYRRQRRAFDAATAGDWQLPADQLRRLQHARRRERETLQRALDDAFAALDALAPTLDPTLPPARVGEARLLYFPAVEGWVGFAEDDHGLVVKRLGALSSQDDGATLGRRLLLPFASIIDRAGQIRILPYGWLREIDFHALPYPLPDGGEAVLLAGRPVVYGLDLPRPAAASSPPIRALVVADPSSNLEAARLEGRMVAGELRRQDSGWTALQLFGDDTDSSTLRRLLPTVDLLHYAGHGIFGGRDGWESALPLAGDALTVADVLALERVPRWVVLSGCETGRSPAGISVESAAGLAQAFITAGSRGVVAAVRPVEDRQAAELVRHFYPAWLGGEPPSQALRQAQLALRDRHPAADWASFRLLEP